MSRFIKTTSGYLNQDHILLIRFGVTKEDEGHDLIQMSDGRIIQTHIEDFDWLAPMLPPENRRMPMEAATEPENRSMPMPPAVEAEAPPAPAAEGQKETLAGGTGEGEAEDAGSSP